MPDAPASKSPPGEDPGAHTTVPNTGSPQPTTATHPSHTHGLKRWVHLSQFRRLLDQGTSSLGPLKATVTELADCIGVCEDVINGKKEYEALKDELEKTFEMLSQHYGKGASPAITASVESLWKDIDRELQGVKVKLSRDRLERFKEASDDLDDVFKCYNRIRDLLQRVSLNADISTWKIVDELATEYRLRSMEPAMSACYNSGQAAEVKRGQCTQGTRTDVIRQMADWADNSDPGSVYWMNGMAGTGKTTISYSLCKQLEASGKLAASFFCTRLLPECRNVNKIIPSIAYQLARFSYPFRCALSDILLNMPDIHTRQLDMQFDALIVQPLLNVKNSLYNHQTVKDTLPENLVVVIDALDECEDKKSTREILGLLLAKSANLSIKFVVSSRPESQIRDHMSEQSVQPGSRVVLHELDERTVQEDITTYLRSALAQMQLTENEITALVERAGVLFIHAATLVRYISYDNFRGNSRARLENVLHASPVAGKKDIDELYTTVLEAVFHNPELDDAEKDDIRNVLHTVICAKEPLTVDAMSKLLRMNDADRVRAALRPLWSILQITGNNELVTTLHASFPEYMLDASRSKEYHCNVPDHSRTLALGCFECLRRIRPQFNICELESSFIPDDEVPELEARVERVVTTEIFYAARYWADHLHSAPESPDLINELEEFLSTRLFLWMEVVNLKQQTKGMPEAIHLAQKWDVRYSEDLKALLCDAGWFTMTFASTPVSTHTPHIYASMLALWPKSRPISRCYTQLTQGMSKSHCTGIAEQHHTFGSTWYLDNMSLLAVFSPDGTQIAVSVIGYILLLNPLTGSRILPPLDVGRDLIFSVEFSSDGTRLVTGAADNTIRVWSTQTGQMVLGPLEGHTNEIHSVTFSPDGSRIVSGSRDRTIRIWDAHTGQLLFGPLPVSGYGIYGRRLKYSPDGCLIISVTRLGLEVMDANNGQVLQTLGRDACDDPFHTLDIPPNGKYVAAASLQGGIRAWDIHTWRPALGALTRATRFLSITSISFSHDGSWIASGSENGIVCLWAQAGDLVLGPLDGHTQPIESLSFSPDNAYMVSSSYERTLRLWDIRSTMTTPGPPHHHTTSITSLVVCGSHHGARVASSSKNGTICVWNAESGDMLACIPNKMFTQLRWPVSDEDDEEAPTKVLQVGFSPDSTRIIVNTIGGVHVFNATTGSVCSLYPSHILSVHPFSVAVVLGFITLGALFIGFPHAYRPAGGAPATQWILEHAQLLLVRLHRLALDSLRIDLGLQPPANPFHALIAQTIILPLVGVFISSNVIPGPVDIYSPSISCVAFSPDGTRIISGSPDGVIRVHDTRTNRLILVITLPAIDENRYRLTSVSFSSDGRRIFSQSDKRKQQLHCAESGELLVDLNDAEWSRAGGFSPDGTLIIIQCSDSICLLRLSTREALPLKGSPPTDFFESKLWLRSFTFTADGSRVAMVLNDGSSGIWNTQTGESFVKSIKVGVRPITSMAFTPDGTHLITGLDDGTICLTDTHLELSRPSDIVPPLPDWDLNPQGWVVDEQSRPLVWIPSELRPALMRPGTKRQMSRQGSVQLNFKDSYLGESWAKCYRPG